MACNLKNVGSSAVSCKENFSGVGTKLFLFLPEDLQAVPTYDEEKAEYTEASFTFKEGKGAYEVILKPKSGKVTSSSNANGGGFSNVFTGIVAKSMDEMSHIARVLNNRNFGAMVSDGSGKYYVLYSPDFDNEFSLESDTGDTPDSDHGHTLTITCSPMLYPLTKWAGTLTMAPAVPSV